MTNRAAPDAASEIFATLTGELEDAAAMAAAAQGIKSQRLAKRAVQRLTKTMQRIEAQLHELEELLE